MSPGLVALAVGIGMLVMWLFVWSSEGVRVVKARDLLAAGATFIDIDSPEQYKSAHPEGAKSVPLEDLPRIAPDLGGREHPIVVYGHSGWRAMFAAWRLRAIGFHEVVSVGTARP